MSELSPRKEQILKAVIVEYITVAEPVPSDLITQKYELGVRSATVRSELAEITEMGLLDQPHTSAGRIPSDTGYRYFVDHLISRRSASSQEKSQVKAIQDEDETLRDLLQETTKVLSRLTHLYAAAATTKDTDVLVRHAVITALGPERAMLVLVLQNGLVENRVLDCPVGMTLEQIGQVNDIISKTIEGKSLGVVAKLKTPGHSSPGTATLLSVVCATLRSTAKELTKGHFVADGEEYIFGQPEFHKSRENLEALVRSMENEELIRSAIVGHTDSTSHVTIGKEHAQSELHPLSITRRAFYVGENEAGAIAVIGPTRMDYERGISVLDFASHAISETLTKIFR